MKYKIIGVLCAAVLSMAFFTGCGASKTQSRETKTEEAHIDDKAQEEQQSGEDTQEVPVADESMAADFTDGTEGGEGSAAGVVLNTDEPLTGKHHAEIAVKDYGTIQVELDADAAPISVTNFVKLAQDGFYDGLTFHRIMEGFMMQGGDPAGNGTGGSDETIKGEFSSNGVENPLSHTRGAASMARSSLPDSASSQFFIVHQDSLFLDGDYAVFGYVTSGMEVVDAVCEAAEPTDGNGTIPSDQQPVIEKITILD